MKILAILVALLALAPAAPAQTLDRSARIATGEEGKTYHNVYGVNLSRHLQAFDVRLIPTEGSGENLDRLAAGEAEIGFAQADIYAERVTRDPERYSQLTLVGRLDDECIYIAYRKDGPVRSLGDLRGPVEGRAPRIAVGPPGSGMHGTWTHMIDLDPGLAAASVEEVGGTLALNQLLAGRFDAVAWVTDPGNLNHVLLRGVHANDALQLMTVNDPKLDYALPDGTRIYEFRRVRIADGVLGSAIFATRLDTVCTSAVLFARSDANPSLLRKLADLVSLQREELVTNPIRP
jgi:TRAP-type uncharacterized transport system substrate-binding protein